eukprot:1034806-Rhodomonas_salina.1
MAAKHTFKFVQTVVKLIMLGHQIGDSIDVFTPGMPCPRLALTSLLASFRLGRNCRHKDFEKSPRERHLRARCPSRVFWCGSLIDPPPRWIIGSVKHHHYPAHPIAVRIPAARWDDADIESVFISLRTVRFVLSYIRHLRTGACAA